MSAASPRGVERSLSPGRPLRSSIIFLLHIALDVPMAVQGLWSPASLPFLQLNNTALVFIKVRRSGWFIVET